MSKRESVNNRCLYFLRAKAAIKTLMKHKSSKLQDEDMKQHPTEDTAKQPIAQKPKMLDISKN